MKEKFLITLATGTTGHAIAKQLLTEGYPVKIYVRSRNKRALELERLGAEIALGEFNNKQQLKAALNGVGSVYYCYPMKKGLVEDIALYIEAAREADIYATVFMGQWLAEFEDAPSLLTRNIQKAYKLLEESQLKVVYYNPGFFADNLVALTESIVQMGMMPSPFGDGKCPWISSGDLGRCAVALLKDPEPYFGKRVHPAGAKAIDANEMTVVYSKVVAHRVKLMPASDKMFMKAVMAAAKEFGYDEFVAVQTAFYMQELRKNRFGEPNNVVKELTGREPEDFETIVRQFIAESPYGKKSFAGKLHAMASFFKLLTASTPSKARQMELNS